MNSIETIYALFQKNPKVSTDSREYLTGSVFFCLKGPNFDANLFARQALEKGAAYVISDAPENKGIERIIVVDDTLKTLQNLSAYHRKKFNFPVIGLTGSNGKTTNKELITAVLKMKYRTYSTQGNLNNHIGVPLTILSIPLSAEMAVVEMGANHRGEIRDLCAISQPDYGLITNIGKAHLEGFGGIEGVKKGKKELFDAISQSGKKVFVNVDDPVLMELSSGLDRVLFGTEGGNSFVSGSLLSAVPYVCFSYAPKEKKSTVIKTKLVGSYNFYNLLTAACIGTFFKIPPPEVKAALEAYTPTNNRSQYITTDKNELILDAYNANPSSVEAALENLAAQNHPAKIALLGQMLELGKTSGEEHQRIVDYIADLRLEALFVGKGYEKCNLHEYLYFDTTDDLIAHLKRHPITNHLILVKGSRMVAMEKILEYL